MRKHRAERCGEEGGYGEGRETERERGAENMTEYWRDGEVGANAV